MAQHDNAFVNFNIYKTNIQNFDPRLTQLARAKTWLFIGSYSLFCIGILAYYAGVAQTRALTKLRPSLSDYLSIQQYSPTCSCTTALSGANAVSVFIPEPADYSRNQCAPIMRIMADATDPQTNLVYLPFYKYFSLSNPNLVVKSSILKLHLQPMNRICLQMLSALQDAVSVVQDVPLGTTLLSPTSVNDTVFRAAYTGFRDLLVRQDILQLTLDTIATQNLLAISDASYGNTAATPTNCSCALPALSRTNASLSIGTSSSPCMYRAAFDPEPSRAAAYSCSVTQNVLFFPMDLFSNNAIVKVFGTVADNSLKLRNVPLYYDTYLEVIVYPIYDYIINATGTDANSRILPGILSFDYNRYFDACSPSSCTYLVTQPISGIEVLVALFGIVGGAATLMFHGINILGDAFARNIIKMDLPGEDDPPVYSRSGGTLMSTGTKRNINAPRPSGTTVGAGGVPSAAGAPGAAGPARMVTRKVAPVTMVEARASDVSGAAAATAAAGNVQSPSESSTLLPRPASSSTGPRANGGDAALKAGDSADPVSTHTITISGVPQHSPTAGIAMTPGGQARRASAGGPPPPGQLYAPSTHVTAV